MNADLAPWIRLAAWLVLGSCFLIAVALLAAQGVRHPTRRRSVWVGCLVALGILWVGELTGTRGWLDRLIPKSRPAGDLEVRVRTSGDAPMPPPTIAQTPPSSAQPVRPLATWPAAVWLGGTAVGLLRLGLAHLRLKVRGRRATPADVESDATAQRLARALGLPSVRVEAWPGLAGPVAYGIRRPTVALPTDFADRFPVEQREAMLAHELAHLAARDPLWLHATTWITALAWWLPLVAWARRRLLAEMEAAADDASALVSGGREALAEALLEVGRSLVPPAPLRGLGMAGAGRPSELARRIRRLLEAREPWQPARRSAPVAASLAILATTGTLAAGSWTGAAGDPLAPRLLARWRSSPIPSIPTPALPSPAPTSPAQEPAAEAPSPLAIASNDPPGDPALVSVAAGVYAQETLATSNLLEKVRLKVVDFPDTPLVEVAQRLQSLAHAADPAAGEVLIQVVGVIDETTPDPDMGTPYTLRTADQVRVRFKAPLRNVTLKAALDAVVAAADSPVGWGPPERGVGAWFHPILVGPRRLVLRIFPVDTLSLRDRLAVLPADATPPVTDLHDLLRHHLTRAGIDLTPPATVRLNSEQGVLIWRGMEADIDKIDAFMNGLNVAGPGVPKPPLSATFEIQILEVPEAPPSNASGRGRSRKGTPELLVSVFPDEPPPVPSTTVPATGGTNALRTETLRVDTQPVLLSEAQLHALSWQLDDTPGLERWAAPQVTATSGKQARIELVDRRNVVTGLDARPGTETNPPSANYRTESLSFGPSIELIPTADGDGWKLFLLASHTEFLGHDDPGKPVVIDGGPSGHPPLRAQQPLPRQRLRQTVGTGRLRPGEALLFRGPAGDRIVRTPRSWFRGPRTETHRSRLYYLVTVAP